MSPSQDSSRRKWKRRASPPQPLGHSVRRAGRGTEMLKQEEFIDVIIPRGGESLIRFVVETLEDPGHQALQGGLPHLRRRLARTSRWRERDHRQRQDPAPRRLQRPGDPPDPQGHGGDFRSAHLRALDGAARGDARRRLFPPVRARRPRWRPRRTGTRSTWS